MADGTVKCIENEIPFDVPDSWAWSRLGSICMPLQYGTSKKSDKAGKIPVIRMGNLQSGEIDYFDLAYSSDKEDIEKYCLNKNDLLFNRTNSPELVGKTALYRGDFPAIFAGYLVRIVPLMVSPLLLNYIMNSDYEKVYCAAVKTDGVNQSNVNAQKIACLIIPIPPQNEQRAISAAVSLAFGQIDTIDRDKSDLQLFITQAKSKILDLAIRGKLVPQDPADEPASVLLERIRAEKEQLIKAGKIKRDKSESYIFRGDDKSYYEKFGNKTVCIDVEIPFEVPKSWCWARFSDIGLVVGGGTPKTSAPSYWEDGTIAWITPADLSGYGEKYICHGGRDITPIGLKESSAQLMPQGSVMFSSRAPIGYTVIAANDICTNQGFKSIVPYIMEMNNYIYYYLKAQLSEIVSRASGTTFKEISGTELGKTLISLPPLQEQKRIVAAIEVMEQQLATIMGSLN